MMNANEFAKNAIEKEKARTNWVKAMNKEFYTDKKNNPLNVIDISIGHTVIVIYANRMGEEDAIGIAKCDNSNRYDHELGLALAYARAIRKDIPNYILNNDWDDEDWNKGNSKNDDLYKDEDWNEDEYLNLNKDYIKFGEIGIGSRFINNNTLYIKVDDSKAYNYDKKNMIVISNNHKINKLVEY